MRSLLAAIGATWAFAAIAQPHTALECREGGDFIRNAALAREYADEAFLRTEVHAVFDAPMASESHRDAFLERCARRAERLAAKSVRQLARPPHP